MIRFLIILLSIVTALGASANSSKSFSKQMNELKRSGKYVYAESSAASEEEAKNACDNLLKIEITKYLASVDPDTQSDGKIVKNIADYNREYLVQPRGEMVRVFGYIDKNDIAAGKKKNSKKKESSPKEDKKKKENENSVTEPQAESVPAEPTTEVVADGAATAADTSTSEVTTEAVGELNTGTLKLAKWQIDMLENIVREPDMLQAKKLLNRYKNQNRVKRLGDRSVSNPRPTDTFHLVYDNAGRPVHLLAPSHGKEHFDMLSGTTVNLDTISGNQFLWFQISK